MAGGDYEEHNWEIITLRIYFNHNNNNWGMLGMVIGERTSISSVQWKHMIYIYMYV